MSSSYFNSNHTGLCETNEVMWKMGNLTASYAAEGSRELTMMIAAPAAVLILVVLFLVGIFNLNAVLDPKHRLLLSSTLALSLPVMSYLFKDAMGEGTGDLPTRAGVILTWMLILELLRKKLDEIRDRESYAGAIQRAGRAAWLGSLVYYNITSTGRKAVFSILWILCATKLVQKIIFTEIEKRWHPDKSWIIFSYMGKTRQAQFQEQHGRLAWSSQDDKLLKMCNYIVMGEEKLVQKVTADGYQLKEITKGDNIITVGTVWKLEETHHEFVLFDRDESIRRICLSFALFKLLRRRFEHLPELTAQEADDCRHLLMKGLCLKDETALFQVMADEVTFLVEYYHSVVPVVLASPSFILANYLLVPVAVLVLCLITIVACGHGDVGYVLSRMRADNYALQHGFAKLAICSLVRAAHLRSAFFFILDLSITTLLFGIFFFQETWELLVLLNSNWLMISVLYNYVTKQEWRQSRAIFRTFRRIMWLRGRMRKYTNIRLKQFSLLHHRRGPLMSFMPAILSLKVIRSVPATNILKISIVNCLRSLSDEGHDRYRRVRNPNLSNLTKGRLLIERIITRLCEDQLPSSSWPWVACTFSDSVTKMILTWHVATCMVHEALPTFRWGSREVAATIDKHSRVAISLSQYRAYLVVFHPELLPDRKAMAELVLEDAKKELRGMLGFWVYYLASQRACVSRLTAIISPEEERDHHWNDDDGAVVRGARLGTLLIDAMRHGGTPEVVWKLLADVWTWLLVYAAASNDEEHVNAHADMLPGGVELITVLWAFFMHTGMPRSDNSTVDDMDACSEV